MASGSESRKFISTWLLSISCRPHLTPAKVHQTCWKQEQSAHAGSRESTVDPGFLTTIFRGSPVSQPRYFLPCLGLILPSPRFDLSSSVRPRATLRPSVRLLGWRHTGSKTGATRGRKLTPVFDPVCLQPTEIDTLRACDYLQQERLYSCQQSARNKNAE